ncbi:MAG: cell division ATP-binding protein FtsE [Armatimonadota bacterium]
MIRFHGVSLVYPNGTRALNNLDLHVAKGEFLFVVGPTGTGKSSVLRLIYREQVPSEGRVIVAGRDVAQLHPRQVPFLRRQVGVIFQDFRLLPDKTVAENVQFALDVLGVSRAEKKKRVRIALELVGLWAKAEMMPHELSGGEQQRTSIARALVNRPPVLLADEPTGNLDPDTSLEIVELLATINTRGTTVVVATHDRYIVDAMQRRVVTLADGTVVRDAERGAYDDEP